MEDDNSNLIFIVLFLIGLCSIKYFLYIKNRKIVTQERSILISQSIPEFIKQSMANFEAGNFSGEDLSPLSYVGYKAGKTANMADAERRQRLSVCFRLEIPPSLPEKYSNWGRPGTFMRLHKMQKHLSMLAGQRQGRRGYELAVSHWLSDQSWFVSELGKTARRFGKYGYKN